MVCPIIQGGHNNKCSAVAEMDDRLATIHMSQKLGALPLWGGGAGFPSNTMWPGPSPTSIQSGILIHPAVWTVWPQQTWADNWELCPFGRDSWISKHDMPTSVRNCILMHPDIWPQQTWAEDYMDAFKMCACKFRKREAAVPLSMGELGPRLTQCGRGRGLPACQVSS